MKVLAFISQKGGSGKTTLAVHMAVCAILAKKTVLLIDLDPQGSAVDWYEARTGDKNLAAVAATEKKLPQLLKKAKEGGADLVIIDTAPHSNKTATKAAELADFVLIPCRPSRFDMKAIGSTLKIIDLTKANAAVVMNVCALGNLGHEARESLKQEGFPVLDIMITQRVAFSHAVIDGRSVHEYEPKGKATRDIEELFNFVKRELKL